MVSLCVFFGGGANRVPRVAHAHVVRKRAGVVVQDLCGGWFELRLFKYWSVGHVSPITVAGTVQSREKLLEGPGKAAATLPTLH